MNVCILCPGSLVLRTLLSKFERFGDFGEKAHNLWGKLENFIEMAPNRFRLFPELLKPSPNLVKTSKISGRSVMRKREIWDVKIEFVVGVFVCILWTATAATREAAANDTEQERHGHRSARSGRRYGKQQKM